MSHQMFDMQAALLYDTAPQVNPEWMKLRLTQQAALHGLDGLFEVLAGMTNDTEMGLSGCGVHVTISRTLTPLPAENFQLQLSAPINRMKAVDFEGIIASHSQAIVINVGDGETPMPLEARSMMAEMGVGAAVDPIIKATVLHLVIQAFADTQAPLMTDFLPSQSLLSPMELEAVADLGLPLPILFHPYPTESEADAQGHTRIGMIAIHSQNLMGKQIELEAIPDGVDTALTINLLASLITEHRKGNLPLSHGDVLQESSEDMALYIRHAAPDTPDGPDRIIVSFDTPAEGPAPEQPVILEEPEPPAPEQAAFATDPETQADQIAFHERVARLKAKAQPDEPGAVPFETALPDTMGTETSAATRSNGKKRHVPVAALKVGIPILLGLGLYVLNPGQMLERKLTAQLVNPAEFEQIVNTVPTNLSEGAQDKPTMHTATLSEGTQNSGESFEATIAAIRAASKPEPAKPSEATPAASKQVTRIELPDAPNGQLIISGRDADGNPVVFSRQIKDDEDRDEIMQGIVQGTLRSEIIKQTQ